MDWSVKQAQSLNAEPKDVVWKFINNVEGNTDLIHGHGKLCEFHFADLRYYGKLSLVVSYDNGGTADCNDVEIFDKTAAGIESYDFDATQDLSLDSIEDIGGNGRYELVLSGGFAGGITGHCIATWPVIYAWNGTGYADVSAEFKGYYRQKLAELQRQLNQPQPEPSPKQAETNESVPGLEMQSSMQQAISAPAPSSEYSDIDCQKAEEAKAKRFLGISRDAGMSDAIKWAGSDDPATRQFAAIVLSDIATPEAIEYLRILSSDPDPNVAKLGKDLSASITAPSVHPMIQGELLGPNFTTPAAK